MNTTVTRFGNLPQAGLQAAMQPNPQPAPAALPQLAAPTMGPAQDVAMLSTQAPATMPGASTAGPSVQFGGAWGSFKNLVWRQSDDVAATFDVKASRAKLRAELKRREILPQRIEEEKAELSRKLKKLRQVRMKQSGIVNGVKAQRDAVQGEIDALESGYQARLKHVAKITKTLKDPSLDKAEQQRLNEELTDFMQSLQDLREKIEAKKAERKVHQTILTQEEQVLKVIMLTMLAAKKKTTETQRQLDEALGHLRIAEAKLRAVETLESTGINEVGEMGNAQQLFVEAMQVAGEANDKLEELLDKTLDQFVEEEEREIRTSQIVTEDNVLSRIQEDLDRVLAEEEDEEEVTVAKTHSAQQ